MFERFKERFRRGQKPAKKQPKILRYEELESRVLFSADFMAGLDLLSVDEQVLVEDVTGGADQFAKEAVPVMVEQTAAQTRRELVIVNSNVADYEQLTADPRGSDTNRGIEVVVLDAGRDGIAQVSEILADRSDLAAVHFITHGADGQINLGNSRLNGNSLQQNSEAVAGWGRALTEKGDLLFYGCNIAAESSGRTLLTDIARLTGADVAASDDPTGQAQYGGDWVLEYDHGNIETALAINSGVPQNWNGVLLNTFTVNTTADTVDAIPGDGSAADALGNTSLRAAIMEANALPGASEIILNAGTYTLTLGPAGDNIALNGDLDVTGELTITGAGADVTIIDGNSLDRVFDLKGNTANLTLTDLTIQGGISHGHGGGIHVGHNLSRLTATRVILTGNTADKGAGIYNHGSMTLTDVVIANNGDAGTSKGGGIYNEKVAILAGVTISGNQADEGGGIYHDNIAGSLSLTNVTVSGNSATNQGGGLHAQKPVTIVNSTITLNSAATGGGISNNGGTIDIKNTIVAKNLATLNPDVDGGFNSQGNNLIGDQGTAGGFTHGMNGDQAGTAGSPIDPLLGSLRDNGGFTQTHALRTGSPAIDAGDNSVGLTDDQRRNPRPIDGNYDATATSDIGAFEYTPVFVSYYLDGAGDGSDIPTAALKTSAPTDTTLDNFDPGRDAFTGLTLAGSDLGLNETDTTKYQQWITAPGAIRLNGPASLSLWSAMKDFDVTKAGSITAYLVDSDAAGNDLTQIASATVTRADWDVANTGTWIEETFDFGVVDYALKADRCLGVKIVVNNGLAADAMWLAYDVTGSPSSLTVVSEPNSGPTGSVNIDNPNPAQGDVLTASNSLADADGLSGPISYQWRRDGVDIGGAGGNSYTTVQDDVGTVITVVASYTDDLGFDESVCSAGTAAVTNVNDPGTVTIDNTSPAQGDTLTAGVADPDGAGGSISYQWYRDGAAIGGATSVAYTTTQDDVGKVMTVTANYTDDLSSVENLTSAGTAAVINVNDAPVLGNNELTISEGATVIFDSSMLSAADVDNPDSGLTFNITAVNGGQFERVSSGLVITAFTQADIAAGEIRFVHDGSEAAPSYNVSVSDGSASTNPTAAAINFSHVNDPGTVTIDNTSPTQGDTLTAGVADPDGAGGGISYQWYRDGAAIGGATAAAYTTTQDDVGKVMNVTANYTDDQLTVESITSAPTLAVANVNDPGTVTIDNTSPTQGDTLTAGLADLDGAGGSISYQWYRDGAVIPGATAAAYTTTQDDVGKVMSVTANYTDDLSGVENLTSAGTAAVINVNDAPVLGNNELTISEGATVVIDSSMLSASDVDNPDSGLTFNITAVTAGQFERVSTGSVITAFTQADIAAGEVRFVHDGSEAAPSYNVSVSDGSASTNPTAAFINFTHVNDPGTVTIDNSSPTQGDTLTAGVADPDGAGGTISYQWYRDGAAIGGATAAAYTTTQADVGQVMTVTASYTDDLLTVESITSAPTLAVINVNDPGTVTIDNTSPTQGDTLTAGVADPDGAGGTISYQWYRDGAAIGGATAAAYTTTQADVGKVMTVTADYTDDLSTVESITSAPTLAVANVNDPGTITIDNLTPSQGDILTAGVADPDGAGGTISYQWYRDGTAIGGATAAAYTATQADVGKVMTVTANYTDDLSSVENLTSAGTAAVINVNDAPVLGNNELTISEGATVIFDSSMLSAADVDNPDSGMTFNITAVNGGQFERVSIGLVITAFTQADIAAGEIRFVHDGSEAAPSYNVSVSDGSASTNPTAAAINFSHVNDPGTVTIDNTSPTQGDTLTAGVADPDGAGGGISYQWYRDGAAIGGATAAAYTTTQADVGKVMTVTADYTDDLLTVESITSAPTLAVANLNDPGTVTIDNTSPSQGDTLTAGVADPDGAGGTISYQWYRDGAAIGGATAAGYTITQADVGKVISVTANYTDDLSSVENLTSAGTAAVINVNDAPVLGNNELTISEGATVIFDSSMLSAADVDNPDSGLTFNITAVNGGQFERVSSGLVITAFTQADIAAGEIRFVHDGSEAAPSYKVSVSDGSASTNPTAAAINFSHVNDPGTVTIDNTSPTQGDTLTAGVADPDGAGGTISYQWYRDGAAIGGATAAAYTTTQADVGKVMTVTADYTDDQLTIESITSAPTPAVANVNDPGTVTIDNTSPTQGDTLTAGVADPDGAGGGISYQWYRDGAAIGGATAAAYTTTQADVGQVMTVTANYTDDLSGVENLTSAGTAAVINVNDAPVLGRNNLAITEGAVVTLDSSMLSATDADHPDSSLIFNVSGVTAGYFAFVSDPATPVTSFVQSDITAGHLVFVHDGSEAQPGYSISVTDGTDSTAASPADIAFSYQNESAPPSIDFLTLPENAADSPDSTVTPAADEVKPGPSEVSNKSDAGAGKSAVSSDKVITVIGLDQGDMADGTVVFVQDSHNVSAAGPTEFRQAELGRNNPNPNGGKTYFSYQRLKLLLEAHNVGELRTALGNLTVKTLSSSDYDLVRNSLDAIKEEIGKEIQLGKTVVGSAIAASIGLSVGYVVWLLKGGSLLASVLSSLPAWQLADPLAILAGHKGGDDEDDDHDDESLETIIDDGSKRDEKKESHVSELNGSKKY